MELNGKFPAILKDPVKGDEAQKLYDEAQNMLDLIINEKWLTAKSSSRDISGLLAWR